MGWLFWKSKRHILKEEAEIIEAEISRSKRFGFQCGVLTVEISHTVPRGLSKILPGRTISFYVLQNNIRLFDQVVKSNLRRKYYIILPQTNKDGVETVKARIYRIAEEQNWKGVLIQSAVYPDDGDNSRVILGKFSNEM